MRYFLDTEFDGFGGRLLSLALVREDGESRYWADTEGAISESWVRENVAPIMRSCPVDVLDLSLCARGIASFLRGDRSPVIVSDWPADIRYFCGVIEMPGGEMVNIPALAFQMIRVDAYPTSLEGAVQHNAWWDAMALRKKLQVY